MPRWDNWRFVHAHRRLRGTPKIVFALTPDHPGLGDHAMAVAVRRWFGRHFAERPVLEINVGEVLRLFPAVRRLVGGDDLVFLHSGGNLGDRYLRTEEGRRVLIEAFPRNRIISLPQLICFSDTPEGRREQAISQRIYNAHPALTVIAREPRSAELAEQLFPRCQTICTPDFALRLEPPAPPSRGSGRPKALLCFRRDVEGVLTADDHARIRDSLPYECETFDTRVDYPIDPGGGEAAVRRALELFRSVDLVVTDRFHGTVFSIVCRTPCVALRTADHKLPSGFTWFKDMAFVALAPTPDDVPALAERCVAVEDRRVPDWDAEYFDKLPALLGLS